MVTAENSNQPFEYRLVTTQNPLKESEDSSNYSKYLTKSSNFNRSRLESSKISPHAFSSNTNEINMDIGYHSEEEEASENFSNVNEADNYMRRDVPLEPQKKAVYPEIVKSPNLLSEESSKASFDKSKSKPTSKNFKNSKKVIYSTQTHPVFPIKFNDLDLNSQERTWRRSRGQQRLTNTFKKLSTSKTKGKNDKKIKLLKLRSTTPSHLFEGGCSRKEIMEDLNKYTATGKNKSKMKFSLLKKGKFTFRNHSSNTPSTFHAPHKSTISVKSRNNRDSSPGSDINIIGFNNSR